MVGMAGILPPQPGRPDRRGGSVLLLGLGLALVLLEQSVDCSVPLAPRLVQCLLGLRYELLRLLAQPALELAELRVDATPRDVAQAIHAVTQVREHLARDHALAGLDRGLDH